MPAIGKNARVCETCGSPIEKTSAGDLGCIACLIGTGLDAEADQSDIIFASPPHQLGAYTIQHHADGSAWELGRGAMGVTYRATDRALDRPVALKIINTDRASHSAEARERFTREARAAAALRHPNVATVYQFGVCEGTGQFFYAMELVEGETLEERVRRLGPLDVLTTIDIALQVTAALEAAEQRGLVHRDLKPGNLMLVARIDETARASTQRGGYSGNAPGVVATALRRRAGRNALGTNQANEKFVVKVIDFGVAKAVAEKTHAMSLTHGGFVGTPAFASPEQFTNAPIDVRSDIYSLGVTLWFLLTGQMLFSGRTVEEIRDARQSKPLPVEQLKAARVPRRFVALLTSMLAMEPAARPAGARELGIRLRRIRASVTERRKIAVRFAMAAAFVALATIIAVRLFHSYPTKATPSAVSEKSIAVLPFADLSQARDQEYFCDGIQGEILTRLSKIRDLKVISRTSTLRFKNAPKNLPKIAKQLGVANILEGTVQKTEDQVRVNVQLVNARSDSNLWSEKYDRKLTDVFDVESEIAKAIADTLHAKLSGSEQRAIATRPTQNPEAHRLYLKGTYFSNKRTAVDLRTAIEYFKDALGKDPNYALAYAGLADAYSLLSLWGGEGPQETMPQAKAAARKALELDDILPEAHNSLGLILALYDFDFAQSKKEFERAIELNPNYATAHHQLGNMNLSMVGEFDRAIAEGNRALELDPLSLIINADLGQNLMLARRYDQAIDHLRKTLAMDERFYYARWTLGEALQLKGQLAEAMAEYKKAVEITDDPVVMAMLAQGYAKTDQRDEARKLLSQLERLSTHRRVAPFTFALVHVALHEHEKAIDELERAYRERDPGIVGIKVEPLLDPLRDHPRFERLVAKVVRAAEDKSPGEW
jgi:serine/threonine protein kinase/Tfp pilus assembly protein PilF